MLNNFLCAEDETNSSFFSKRVYNSTLFSERAQGVANRNKITNANKQRERSSYFVVNDFTFSYLQFVKLLLSESKCRE